MSGTEMMMNVIATGSTELKLPDCKVQLYRLVSQLFQLQNVEIVDCPSKKKVFLSYKNSEPLTTVQLPSLEIH